MKTPIVNQATTKSLEQLARKMPQSLLVTGDEGVGLSFICKHIASSMGVTPIIILPEKDEKIDLEKGIIGVDIIRRLLTDTRTTSNAKRVFIIDYAERMNHQAQNAFLKLLEEPGNDVYFIIASHSIDKLLPTILSRTEKIEIHHISTEQSEKLLDLLGVNDATKRSQLLFMAEGLPAELTRLSTDDEYFDKRVKIVRDAREMLRGTNYQKLLIINRCRDSRPGALLLLSDMSKILKRTIIDNPSIESINHIDKILDAYSKIEANGNIRLCLARMIE